MIDILKAAVYCGTYKKYNEGSLDGAWMKLINYPNSESFLKACTEVHKDENDPEFMFQDTEYVPKEFYSESCIYPELFQVIQRVNQMPEDQQNDFAAFCEDNAAIPDMFDVDEFLLTYKPSKKTNNNSPLNEFKEKFKDWYYLNRIADVVKMDEQHYITFEKPRMEKEFCWGYGSQGLTYEEASELCKSFNEDDFRSENLDRAKSKYESVLNRLDENIRLAQEYNTSTLPVYGAEIMYIAKDNIDPQKDTDITLSKEDSERVKELVKDCTQRILDKFEKQINTYLKKYGLSKIRKWTYWADE